MKWNEFLQKLTLARKQEKDKKISASVLAVLIFSGVFDSMIEDTESPSIELYTRMFEEVKKIKKSVAKLPSKKAGEFIGLDEVNSMTHLTLWRNQRSPIIKKLSLENEVEGPLKHRGYKRVTKEGTIFTFIRGADEKNKIPGALGTPKWSEVFKEGRLETHFKSKTLLIYGIIHDVKILPYGADRDKERMCFTVFTGHEFTNELVLWPKRDTGKLSEVYKADIRNGVMAAFHVRPSLYNEKRTGTVLSMVKFTI